MTHEPGQTNTPAAMISACAPSDELRTSYSAFDADYQQETTHAGLTSPARLGED